MEESERQESEMVGVTAFVHGRVQGVGFRFSTVERARRLGVCGWVRNEPDGTVHVECEGARPRIERFLTWLKQGPPGAYVTHVDINWSPYRGEYRGFSVR